jgi:CBS domain-containing protein
MSRRDAHFDAMLRNLGAAYYQTTKGTARAADVTRALESVAAEDNRLRELGHEADGAEHPSHRPHTGRWRVSDVMTTKVVTVTTAARYQEIVRLMTEYKVNAVPVVTVGDHVIGMVSEADLLRKQERNFRRLGTGLPLRTRHQRAQARAHTAGDLMTSPAITIYPHAPLGAAARLMNGHNIRRLPVVDGKGKLVGIVTRRDLLSVFLRSDGEIAAEVRRATSVILLDEADAVSVSARHGVVTLTGTLSRKDLIPVVVHLAEDVDGVVAVHSKLGLQPVTPAAS